MKKAFGDEYLEKLKAIAIKGNAESVGFLKGVIESEYRKILAAKEARKKGA